MKKQTNKRLLFERMEAVNPDYKRPLNEERLSREAMVSALQQKFNLSHIETSEEFDGSDGGIWLSAENGETASDDRELFNYYSEDHDNYTFGVHNEFQNFCEKNGWYPEWHDPGTLMIWED